MKVLNIPFQFVFFLIFSAFCGVFTAQIIMYFGTWSVVAPIVLLGFSLYFVVDCFKMILKEVKGG